MRVKDFKAVLRNDVELPKELAWFLEGRSDNDELDLLNRNDYFAVKLWMREDVREVFEDLNGFSPSEEEIDEVINHGGRWPYLTDCRDGEWDCIAEEVRAVFN